MGFEGEIRFGVEVIGDESDPARRVGGVGELFDPAAAGVAVGVRCRDGLLPDGGRRSRQLVDELPSGYRVWGSGVHRSTRGCGEGSCRVTSGLERAAAPPIPARATVDWRDPSMSTVTRGFLDGPWRSRVVATAGQIAVCDAELVDLEVRDLDLAEGDAVAASAPRPPCSTRAPDPCRSARRRA